VRITHERHGNDRSTRLKPSSCFPSNSAQQRSASAAAAMRLPALLQKAGTAAHSTLPNTMLLLPQHLTRTVMHGLALAPKAKT
jgi:hypothetical protein